jgi:hypothetical protein
VVSAQWASRPDDQRFLNLGDLHAQVSQWAAESTTREVMPAKIVANGSEEGDQTALTIDCDGVVLDPTHFAFGQLCGLIGAPAEYLRRLSAPMAAMNINYGLQAAKQTPKSAYQWKNGGHHLRALTSTQYGRILDRSVVEAVQQIAGNGDGKDGFRWKVPGLIDWATSSYNPNVDVTKETTTLYASDRDVFMFLVDDRHPISIGKLPSGDDDLVFRGFYTWNSEVGNRKFGIATFYLRGVCANRCLWGVEGFSELTFAHRSGAPERFAEEVTPALLSYAEMDTVKLLTGVKQAKAKVVAKTDEERVEFLARHQFSENQAKALIILGELEEGHPPASVWDFAQCITAQARSVAYQDRRIHLERVAGKLLDKVA